MTIKQIAVVAAVALTLVGCGDDRNDATGGSAGRGFFGTIAPVEEEPGIVVLAAPEAGHEDHEEAGAAREAAPPEPMDDGSETADHEAMEADDADEAVHDDDGAVHDDDGAVHDDDGAVHDDDGAGHDADEATDPEPAAAETGIVVAVEMLEFGYMLDRDTVPVGEPVTFRFVNGGQIEHEAMFGSIHQQEEFATSDGHGDHGSEGHHGDIAAITLDSEAAAEMVMVFDTPGEVLIGCHLPGHWDAGMSASFNVVTA